MPLSVYIDRIASCMVDPWNERRTPVKKGMAWTASVILGVGTLGISHLLSARWRKARHIKGNDTQSKIKQLFQKKVSKDNHQEASSPVDNSERQAWDQLHADLARKNEAAKARQQALQAAVKKQKVEAPLQKAVKNVEQKQEQFWEASIKEAGGNKEQALVIFINKIREEFRRAGSSFSEISQDPKALAVFFQNPRLRRALVEYAKVNKLDDVLHQHLLLLAKNTFNQRDEYTQKAAQSADNLTELFVNLTVILDVTFEQEGRSLSEVIQNPEARAIFEKSDRLAVVLALYLKMKEKRQPRAENDPAEQKLQNAIHLGKVNAKGPGLATRVGLKEVQEDPEQLKRGLKKFLLLNHPDKNPDADLELVKDATDLLNLLNAGVYEDYQKALKKYRQEEK